MRGSENKSRLPSSKDTIIVPPYTGGDNKSRVERHERKRAQDIRRQQRLQRPRGAALTLRELSEQVEDQLLAFMPDEAILERQAQENYEIVKFALSELNIPHAILFHLTAEEAEDILLNAHDKVSELSETLNLDLKTLSFLFLHVEETQKLILYCIFTDQPIVEIALDEEYFENAHVLLESILFYLQDYDIELRPSLSEKRRNETDELEAMFDTTQAAKLEAERVEKENGITVEKKEKKKQRRKTKRTRSKRKRR